MVENLGTTGFLLNSDGRRGAFPSSCSLLSAILPHRLYLPCPPSQRSQPLWMCCSAEQMRRSSTSSCSTRNCCQSLEFLFQHCRFWIQSKGQADVQQPWGRGKVTPAISLLGWQLCWCVESVSPFSVSGTYCWSNLQGRKGSSWATTVWSWLVDADT